MLDVFSPSTFVFVANTEHKIGLLHSMAIHISVTTCDACDDHVVRNPRPVFAYCKQSKTAWRWEGLGMRLVQHIQLYL